MPFNNNNERTNRPAVQFLTNIPVEIALKYPDGKMVQGMYGDRMMYTLTDGRVMFVDYNVAEQINMLEPSPGEVFFIQKSRANAKGASNLWKVWREVPGEPPTVAGESGLERQLRHSIAAAAVRPQSPHGVLVLDKQAPAASGPARTPVYGNPAPAAARPAIAPPLKPTYGEAMAQFLLMAGRAVRQTETTLGAEGAAVKFDSRDVAALATTLFIQAAREGFIQFKAGEGA